MLMKQGSTQTNPNQPKSKQTTIFGCFRLIWVGLGDLGCFGFVWVGLVWFGLITNMCKGFIIFIFFHLKI